MLSLSTHHYIMNFEMLLSSQAAQYSHIISQDKIYQLITDLSDINLSNLKCYIQIS